MNKLNPPVELLEEIEVTTFKANYGMALASILAAVLSGCADFRPNGTTSSAADENITADAEARLNQMPDLGPPGSIVAPTRDHVVYQQM